MRIIGLTGTIGSGKTTVSQLLRHMGAQIVCADTISRRLQCPGQAGYAAIQAQWPDCILPDGELDRLKLAELIFNDETQRARLNAIMHPLITQRIKERFLEIEKQYGPDAIVVLDAALLIEAGLQDLVQEVWLVVTDEERLIGRIAQRDGITAKQALARIRSQMPLNDKLPFAHYVLENNGTLEDIQQKVERLFFETQAKTLED